MDKQNTTKNSNQTDETVRYNTRQWTKHRDGFEARKDLDGKNDSGPDPEVHGRELPPQN